MDSSKNRWGGTSAWVGVIAGGFVLSLGLDAVPRADADVIMVPTQFSTLINSGGDTYAVVGDLVIQNGGSILCNDPAVPATNSACPIKITVTGNLIMMAGSAIFAENRFNGGNGADITITVDGDMTLCGPNSALAACVPPSGAAGVKISSSDGPRGGQGRQRHHHGRQFPEHAPRRRVHHGAGQRGLGQRSLGRRDHRHRGLEMHIDGLVRSFGRAGGTGANQPTGGGPITLKSGCVLEVTPDGVISSEGRDPGADLVHLEGCEVIVNGLVQSIA